IHAATRKPSPITTTSSRMPSRTYPDCDHHDTRARCRMRSPSTSESSMYDMSGPPLPWERAGERVEVSRRDELGNERLERPRVGFVEAPWGGAVEVEHAEHLAILANGHHDLAAGSRITRDMARELVHVRHDDRAPLRDRGATYAPAYRNTHACGLAL